MGLLTMKPTTFRIALAATSLVCMSGVAAAVYFTWPRAEPAPALASTPPHGSMSLASLPGVSAAPAAGNLEVLATRLAARLQNRDTEDGEGWALLGRSYAVLGRHQEALAALERARRLLGDSDPQLMADYAAAKNAVSASTRTAAGNPATRAR
jgi:cytochrome c-type biogenesis protein CcmH